MLPNYLLHPILQRALMEDIGPGDVTTGAVLTGGEQGTARAIAKTQLVVAGTEVFREVFSLVDASLSVQISCKDGEIASPGDILAEITGDLSSILTAERTALNFFQRMCGIATLTRCFVEAVKGTGASILDTRKTLPGLRLLDKYAVRIGGGHNHRFALFDGVLIKDNHIDAAGGISPAVARARLAIAHTLKIEVECKNIAEVMEALAAGVDAVMLDNMDAAAMREAVTLVGRRIPLEASGNITLSNVRVVAETGVDFISVGALTHSVTAADISLRIQGVE